MRTRVLGVLLTLAVLIGGGTLARAADGDPNDPLFAETETSFGQWALRQINAPAAWTTTTGVGSIIGIVDTGADLGHEDLAANLLPGRTFNDKPGCGGPAGCGNGSWEPSEFDPEGPAHGTHVSGIAAAVTNNGKGIAGVAPDAKILPINVFSDGVPQIQAFSDDVARGIDWAVDNGADVINLSLGSLPLVGQAIDLLPGDPILEAIARANDAGVVVVAAAGNEVFPLCDSPAWSEGVLCVGGTDFFGSPAPTYSNFPVKPDLLGVRAPGGTGLPICELGIVSTLPAGHGNCDYDAASQYGEYDGTSMAAPHVTGLAALVRALGCDRQQTLDIITSTAVNPLTGESGAYEPVYGYGIVDAAAAATAAQTRC